MLQNIFVILAGGSGSRFNSSVPKQLVKIDGKPIIEHTLDQILKIPDIDQIIIVAKDTILKELQKIIANKKCNISLVKGGKNRLESTYCALQSINKEVNGKILIHDAVRPFIKLEAIKECYHALDNYDAVTLTIPISDSILTVSDNDMIKSFPNRNQFKRIQTPQGFKIDQLQETFKLINLQNDSFTDDCSVFLKHNPRAKIGSITGCETNIKITYPIDIAQAKFLIQHQKE